MFFEARLVVGELNESGKFYNLRKKVCQSSYVTMEDFVKKRNSKFYESLIFKIWRKITHTKTCETVSKSDKSNDSRVLRLFWSRNKGLSDSITNFKEPDPKCSLFNQTFKCLLIFPSKSNLFSQKTSKKQPHTS